MGKIMWYPTSRGYIFEMHMFAMKTWSQALSLIHIGLYKLNTFGEINSSELQCLLWLATLEKASNLKGSFIAAFERGRDNLSKNIFVPH